VGRSHSLAPDGHPRPAGASTVKLGPVASYPQVRHAAGTETASRLSPRASWPSDSTTLPTDASHYSAPCFMFAPGCVHPRAIGADRVARLRRACNPTAPSLTRRFSPPPRPTPDWAAPWSARWTRPYGTSTRVTHLAATIGRTMARRASTTCHGHAIDAKAWALATHSGDASTGCRRGRLAPRGWRSPASLRP